MGESPFARRLAAFYLASLCSVVAAPARSDDGYPNLMGSVEIQVKDFFVDELDTQTSRTNDLFTEAELGLGLNFTSHFSVESTLKLEPARDLIPGDHRTFHDHGAFVDEVFLNADFDSFTLRAGKYNVNFGISFDELNGVFAEEIGKQNYELPERVGLGGAMRFGADAVGEIELAASLFFADTTTLSNSALTKRGRVLESDGGLSNTNDLSSYAVSLDIERIAGVSGMNGHFAYRNQEEGVTELRHEEGIVAAFYGVVEVSSGVFFSPLVEFVALSAPDAVVEKRDILTISSSVQVDKWRGTVTYINRDTESTQPIEFDGVDQLIEVTAGYDFANGISVDAGYLHRKGYSDTSEGVVAKLAWGKSF